MSRRTETAYKAWSPGKPAGLPFRVEHVEAQDTGKCCGCVVEVHVLIRGDLLRRH
ncbi:MAG: hypothetical protein RBR67_12545 [Desulfobacterium sp.]|nr:hypothetical protein [Desulfobacterium sp.]